MIKPLNAATTEKGRLKMRLIDADALKAKIRKAEKEFRRCKIEPVGYKMAFADGVGAVADLIVDEVPTVEERQHEHWTKDNKCSGCGAERPTQGINKWIYLDAKYCYACGATMDEVGK